MYVYCGRVEQLYSTFEDRIHTFIWNSEVRKYFRKYIVGKYGSTFVRFVRMYFRKYFRKYTYNVVHVLPYFRTKVRVLSKEISLSYFRKYVYGSKLLSYFRTCTTYFRKYFRAYVVSCYFRTCTLKVQLLLK